jgi:hypothetical protein
MKSLVSVIVLGSAALAGLFATLGNRVLMAETALGARLGDSASDTKNPNPPPPTSSSSGLVVHEWGTFTSFSGSNGVPVGFRPNNSDLPAFVYRLGGDPDSKAALLNAFGTVSMETPVIYLYSDREMQTSVRVGFPKGWITEWYPHAANPPDENARRPKPGATIRWDVTLRPSLREPTEGPVTETGLPLGNWTIVFANGVTEMCEIRKNSTVSVAEPRRSSNGKAEVKDGSVVISYEDGPVERWKPDGDRYVVEHWSTRGQFPADPPVVGTARGNPYYHARETDAVPLQTTFADVVNGRRITEQEKFLFYRGVGTFPPPVTVRADSGGKVRVTNAAGGRVTGVVLVAVRNGRVGFRALSNLDGGQEVAAMLPEAAGGPAELGKAMEKALVAAGLYDREAQAMVKTWNHAWFREEGTRVLYILPRARTDELLPLTITPTPTEMTRVIVGRHDFLTPEQEDAAEAQLMRIRTAQTELTAAEEKLMGLGRFAVEARRMAQERLDAKAKR